MRPLAFLSRVVSPFNAACVAACLAGPALASDVVQCGYEARVLDAPTPLPARDGTPQVKVALQLARLTRPGGHSPERCREPGLAASGQRVEVELGLAAPHWTQFVQKGATVEVTFTEVWSVGAGPDEMHHSAEWTLEPPKRSHAELSGVAAPDPSLPDAAAMQAALARFVAAHPEKVLRFDAHGTLKRGCSTGRRCDDRDETPIFGFEHGGLSISLANSGPLAAGKALTEAGLLMFEVDVPGVALPGWQVAFGSHQPFRGRADDGTFSGLSVTNGRLVGTLRFSLNWIAADKRGDRYCTAPSGQTPPQDVCNASVQDLGWLVEVDVDLALDERAVDCTQGGAGCGPE